MAYIIQEGKPYYFDGSKVYPCSVSADTIIVDFEKPETKKHTITDIYNEATIRHRLGIKKILSWDIEKDKPKKITNKTISSIVTEPEESEDDEG